MENLDAYEHENYQKAAPVGVSTSEYLWRNIVIQAKIFVVLILEIFENVVKIFFGKKVKDISNQLALVTGGANGIGREIACRLAREKCNVAVVDVNFRDAQATAEFIKNKFGVKSEAFKCDVSNFDDIQKLKVDIERDLGFVDILVNNAGILPLISLREGEPKDIQKIINVNCTSHFWTVRTFLDGMIERKRGHIVAMSSIAGTITFPCAVVYCTSKFAVTGFMRALYDELCAYDHEDIIDLTTIFPTFVNTRKELGDLLDCFEEFMPRLEPENVAESVVAAIIKSKREILLPWLANLVWLLLRFLPRKSKKVLTCGSLDINSYKKKFKKC